MTDVLRGVRSMRLALCGLAAVLAPVLGEPAQTSSPSVERKAEFVASGGDITKLLIVDDRSIVVGIGPYMLYVWSIETGKLISHRTVQYPENRLRDVTVAPSGKVLAYLVSGEQSEVVFVSLDTGQRVDVSSGQMIAAAPPTGKAGVGSWRLPAAREAGAAIPIPRSVGVKEKSGSQLASVAVAYSSGVIQLLDVQKTAVSTVDTGMSGLREVTFNQQGTLAWVGANGYGTLNAEGKLANTQFPNSSAWVSDNQWVMLSHRDGGSLVRKHDMKAGSPRDTLWKDNEFEIEELQPFGQRYFAMYRNGEFGMHDDAGRPLGGHLTLQPGLQTVSNIQVTDVAVSPKGLVAVARGPVVTVYQVDSTTRR